MDLKKNFKSYVMKNPVCKLDRTHREPFFCTLSGSTKSMNNQNDNWSVESCFRCYRLVVPAKDQRDKVLHTLRMEERSPVTFKHP